MNIADLFFGTHLDDTGLQADVLKAGNKAGLTMGQQMSSKLSIGLHAGLA